MPQPPRRRKIATLSRRLFTSTLLAVASGVALTPTAALAATTPVVVASYVTDASAGCEAGDLPLAGGYHSYGDPHLLHLHPEGDSGSKGTWNVDHESVGPTDVVCLDLGRPVTWTVRSKGLSPTSPDGSVSCQGTESLLGGGYYVPWGPGGMAASHPEAPSRWHVKGAPYTDGSAPNAWTYALCADLPTESHAYTVTARTPGAGDVTANCFAGHAVLGGGWAGAGVRGSGPVDGGWTASFGDGGGSAYAVCVAPGAALGLERTYAVTSPTAGSSSSFTTASCNPGDLLLGGGWRSGGPLSSLRVFEPIGAGSGAGSGGTAAGWQVDNGPASALCGVPFVEPPPVITVSRVGFGLLGLAGLTAVIIGATGRPRLAPIKGLRPGLLAGGAAATIGAVIIGLVTIPASPTEAAQARHPLDYQTVRPGTIPTSGSSSSVVPTATTPVATTGTSTSAGSSTSPTTSTRPATATSAPHATSTPGRQTSTSSHTTAATPSVTLTASPANNYDTCAPYAPPVTVTLNPGQSGAAVSWTATVAEHLSNGQWWATLEGDQQTTVSGTIAVGSTGSFTITPRNPDACQQTGTFHVTVTYGPAGYPKTKTLTVSDTLKRLG